VRTLDSGSTGADAAADGGTQPLPAEAGLDASVGTPDSGGDGAVPKCGPTPTALVDFNVFAGQTGGPPYNAMQLAVDGTSVFFVYNRELMQVPARGGPVSTLYPLQPVSLQDNAEHDPIATSNAVVLHYPVDDSGSDTIVSVPKNGDPATTLATSNGFVLGFVADETTLYFADADGIKSVPLAGGDATLLSSDVGDLRRPALALDGAILIVANEAISALPIDGGSVTPLTGPLGSTFLVPCDSDACWWQEGSGPVLIAPGAIGTLSNGGITTVTAGPGPISIAFDGTDFFETDGCFSMIPTLPGTCSMPLLRIPASGAPLQQLMPATFVAIDDECIYTSIYTRMPYLGASSDGGPPPSGIFSLAK
jgi:hypothetical protein